MCLSRDAVAHKIDSMCDVVEGIDALHLNDMRLVVREIVIGQDSRLYSLKIRTFFELYIHHTTMDTCAQRNRHTQGILHARFGLRGYRMTHRTTRTEIGVGQAFRSKRHKDGTDHRVRTRIPTRGDDTDGFIGLTHSV